MARLGLRVRGGLSVIAALTLVAGLFAVGAQRAHAQQEHQVVFSLDFSGMLPGVPMVRSGSFQLPRPGTLAAFSWQGRSGVLTDAELEVEICRAPSDCLDVNEIPPGTVFTEGHVTATATLAGDTKPGATGNAIGRLSFTGTELDRQTGGTLPATGATSAELVAWAAALLLVGLAIVARRGNPVRR